MTPNMKLERYDAWAVFHTQFTCIAPCLDMLSLNVLQHVLLAAVAVTAVSALPNPSGLTLDHVAGNFL